MCRSALHASILLVTVGCLTVTQGQYFDIFQGLQQILQPYQQQPDIYSHYSSNNRQTNTHKQTNRHETKKKTQEEEDRHTKKPPIHQYEYVFATTTPKPSRKTPKPSSHANKQNSNKNINSEIISNFYTSNYETTTKRNRVTTNSWVNPTTKKPNHRVTTESNIYNNKKPVTEKIYPSNNRNVHVGNYETHSNLQDKRPSTTTGNLDYNSYNRGTSNNWNSNQPNRGVINNFEKPTNTRNPDVFAVNNPKNQNNRNNLGSSTNGFTNNNNFGGNINNRYNNRGVLNTDFDENSQGNNYNYPGNPSTIKPGVVTLPIDVNQPPITNKPPRDRNYFRPSGEGYGSYTERPDTPDILIGPNEDDMTDSQKRKYINLAERMCDRYKSLDMKEIVALPLLPSPDPVEFNITSCVPITAPLVIGGRPATINEFPHMALVGWRKKDSSGYSWKCGGSLISKQYILTAGHCTYQDKDADVDSGPPQAVQLGSTYLDDPGALVVKISAVIRHPKYKLRRSYHDIALVKLAHTVTFSEVVRPACLGVPPPVGRNIIATGWGRTEFGGDHSVELRSVSLPVWNMSECRKIWGTSLKLPNGPTPDSHVCAGEKSGGKDTCQGDSGGPAQIQDGCVWRIVAVTSFGRSCGAPNTPALYAVTKQAFIAAQIFGEEEEEIHNNQNGNFDDRGRPIYENKQPSYSNRPTYENRQPSYENRQPSYENTQPSYENTQLSYNNGRPSYESRLPSYENRQPTYENRQPTYENRPPTYENRQPTYENRQPSYGTRQPSYENRQPTYENRQPSYENRQPSYENRQPTYENSQPFYENRQPTYWQPTYTVNSYRS